jgi:hypothetical protein
MSIKLACGSMWKHVWICTNIEIKRNEGNGSKTIHDFILLLAKN